MLRSRDLEELEAWLVERALEHDAPKVLFRLARERLRTERLVFPAPDRIVRLLSSVRGRAQERTYTLVEPLLSAERRAQLDGLLEAKASSSWSTLKWLGQGASGESPGSIKSEVAQLRRGDSAYGRQRRRLPLGRQPRGGRGGHTAVPKRCSTDAGTTSTSW